MVIKLGRGLEVVINILKPDIKNIIQDKQENYKHPIE